MNRRYFEGYYAPEAGRPRVSLEFLETLAPFLAREVRRQGRLRPEDRPALPEPSQR